MADHVTADIQGFRVIATVLLLLAALTCAFLAGMRFAVELRERRENRRGGYVDLTYPVDWLNGKR